jgi:hypothetical protein
MHVSCLVLVWKREDKDSGVEYFILNFQQVPVVVARSPNSQTTSPPKFGPPHCPPARRVTRKRLINIYLHRLPNGTAVDKLNLPQLKRLKSGHFLVRYSNVGL